MDQDFRPFRERLIAAMKNPFSAVLLIVLLIASFLGGAWYSQHGAGRNLEKERRILHYVDPMNPVNVSDKPGIAPCGMPMEPVYGNEESAGTGLLLSPGAVKITLQKQQIIGVQVGTAETMPSNYEVRTIGRVTLDENRVFPLIVASDGWLGEIQNVTTGSLVIKDQLMAKINIYNYDFYTWQTRYLTEFAGRGQRRTSTPAEARLSGFIQPRVPKPSEPQPENTQPAMTATTAPQTGETLPDAHCSESPAPDTKEPEASQPSGPESEPPQSKVRAPDATPESTVQIARDPMDSRADDTIYFSKSKFELLNLGVGKAQLEELARTAQNISTIEIRSPVNGLVISRGIFSNQRVERGTECFRVADLGRMWIIADVFSAEAKYIQPGSPAMIFLPGQDRHFQARVSDVLPKLDAATRTLKVRLEMENPDNLLLPDMFVDVEFRIPLPATLTVPESAVLDSGRKKTVFLALGDGFFEPRAVTTGWRSGGRVEILEGLTPGDRIVISGNFLIDSESRMRLAAEHRHD